MFELWGLEVPVLPAAVVVGVVPAGGVVPGALVVAAGGVVPAGVVSPEGATTPDEEAATHMAGLPV